MMAISSLLICICLVALAEANSIPRSPLTHVKSVHTAEEIWDDFESTGKALTELDRKSLLCRGLAAGCFIGLGGILTASVGLDMKKAPWESGNGFERFMMGAVGFPLAIFLASMTGNGAWTADMSLVAKSYLSGALSLTSIMRFSTMAYLSAAAGVVLAAVFATTAGLPACVPTIGLSEHKLAMSFLQIFTRGIGGSFLIGLAIFMSRMSRDVTGRIVSIWFPISAYVISDYEHVIASIFFMTCGKLNGATYEWLDVLKYLVPATLGNTVGQLLLGGALGSIPRTLRSN